MSGHTTTAACAPLDGYTKYASQVPSGVLISTSFSVTACAFAACGSITARPTPAARPPKSRRVTRPAAIAFSRSSSKMSFSHMRAFPLCYWAYRKSVPWCVRLYRVFVARSCKECFELRGQQIRRFLGDVMPRRQRATRDLGRAFRLPVLERREEPMHDSALAPERVRTAVDTACVVRGVVRKIDRGGGAIVFAHRMNRRRAREAALVLGERALVERRQPFGAPRAELRPQVERRRRPNQPLRQRRGLNQEEPVVIRARELRRRPLVHRRRRRDVEQYQLAHRLRMIEREPMRDAAAAVVAADEELLEAEAAHQR